MADKPISQFPAANSVNASDVLAGVQDGVTKKFSFAIVLNWLKQQLGSLFVPTSREINGKALDADITLDASDVGAVDTADVGVADGVASLDSTGKVPGTQLDLSGKQDKITASGILKGDGQGGVSAATAGTDYGTYSKPSGGIPSTDMTSAVQTSLGKADTAYQKPSSGIPSSDMASGVQTSLGKADTAYQKPSGGIPASDLANGVIPTVPSAYTSNPEMDGTASPGSSGVWARGDHVHPSDTTKAPAGYGLGVSLNTMFAVADANSISATGWYVTYYNTQNLPSGLTGESLLGTIYCAARGTAYKYQEYYDHPNKTVYTRFSNDNGWGPWVKTIDPQAYGLGVLLNTQESITDANAVAATGWFSTAANVTDNLPVAKTTGAATGALMSIARGDLFRYQIYVSYTEAKIYHRIKNSATWGAWQTAFTL